MKDVISVIVPVYNVAPYLPEALESILGQDYKQLEVILIDDGSKDESGKICDKYAARDSRVRVIHQNNGGAAAAKNAGLRIATGEFLSFVDSDDYLEPGVYSYMLALLKQEQGDVVHCAFRNVYRDHAEDFVLSPGRHMEDVETYLNRFPEDWTCALLWNKLYRRELYDGIFFEEGHRIDDEFFTYKGIMNAQKILLDDKIIYNYRRRASSAMHASKAREQLMLDRLDFMGKRRAQVKARFPRLKWKYDVNFLVTLCYLRRDPDNTPATMAMLKQELKQYLWTPGNTRPPRDLWGRLWELYWTGTEKLLKGCDQPREASDLENFFA